MLRATNLWRYFGRTAAVSGIDMEVEAGSAYGFIGPNGAGKTTTLRLLSTLDRPTAGSIAIDGEDAHLNLDRVRPKIGFMPDPFELYDELTVEQHLEFFAQAYRLPRRDRRRRVEASIELCRVGDRRDEKCGTLSKGWKQRVLLAKTLVHDPSLLLLDEPASGLDPAARIEFRGIVRDLVGRGKTVIVSSHILTELADFCDSCGIVERGRMLVSGKIDDIQRRLDPTTRLDVEVLGDAAAARRILEARPEIGKVDAGERPGTLVARGRLGEDPASARADILSALVGGGVRVASFSAHRDGLEDLFLRVAAETAADAGPGRKRLLATLGGTPPPAPPPPDERTRAQAISQVALAASPSASAGPERGAGEATRLTLPEPASPDSGPADGEVPR